MTATFETAGAAFHEEMNNRVRYVPTLNEVSQSTQSSANTDPTAAMVSEDDEEHHENYEHEHGNDLPPDFDLDGIFDDDDEDGGGDNGDGDNNGREREGGGGNDKAPGGGPEEVTSSHHGDSRHANDDDEASSSESESSSSDSDSDEELIESVNNYDVLLARDSSTGGGSISGSGAAAASGGPESSSFGGYVFAPPSHVGNNRLRVIVSMHRSDYEEALTSGNDEECRRISAQIVDTICLNCVPNGRFLEIVEDGSERGRLAYRDIGSERAGEVVRAFGARCFAPPPQTQTSNLAEQHAAEGRHPPPVGSARRRRSSVTKPLRDGIDRMGLASPSPALPPFPEAASAATNTSPVTSGDEGVGVAQSTGPRIHRKIRLFRRRPRAADRKSVPEEVQSKSNAEEEEDGEKKRGRTSSLLRRSRQSVNDITRAIKAACTRKSKRNSSKGEDDETDDTAMPLVISEGIPQSDLTDADVLVAGEGGEGILTTTNVGNNRLRVLIDMNRAKYSSARSDHEKDAIAKLIVDQSRHPTASSGNSRGRFLMQDLLTGLHHEISDDKARETVSHCLSTKPGKAGATRSIAFGMNGGSSAGSAGNYRKPEQKQRVAIEELMKHKDRRAVLNKAERMNDGGDNKGGGGGKKKVTMKLGDLAKRKDFHEIMKLANST